MVERRGEDGAQQFVRRRLLDQRSERTVEVQTAVVDHQDARTELLDIVHVVTGQQDRRAVRAVEVAQEVTHALLRDDVEADRRFVEEEDGRAVDQRRQQFHLHPLAERQFADLHPQQVRHIQHRGEFVHRVPERYRGQTVHLLVQQECFHRRDIPDKHIFLAHHQRDPPQVRGFAANRRVPQHRDAAPARVKQAAEHLERRRLARAIGPQKADDLAHLDAERHAVDGARFQRLAAHEAFQRTAQTGLLAMILVRFGQVACVDRRHTRCRSSRVRRAAPGASSQRPGRGRRRRRRSAAAGRRRRRPA